MKNILTSLLVLFSITCFSQLADITTQNKIDSLRVIVGQGGTSKVALNIDLGKTSNLSYYAYRVPVNSDLIGFGNSITNNFYASPPQSKTNGFFGWANLLAGSPFTLPIGFNKGISGETTTQMVARLGAATSMKAKIATVEAGTNDINAGVTDSVVIANLKLIINGFISNGTVVVISTIPPRYDANAFNTQKENYRLSVNSWIRTISNPMVKVVDADFLTSSDFSDGLHPNTVGAYKYGKAFATVFKKYVTDTSSSSGLMNSSDKSFVLNGLMVGTGGSANNGASGAVSTSYILDAGSAGGATVVGSKTTDNNLNQQVVTLSGTKTGTANNASIRTSINTANPIYLNDLFEYLADIEVLSTPVNVAGITLDITFSTSAGSTASFNGPYNSENILMPNGVGRYTYRTPQIQIPTSAPITAINCIIRFWLMDGSISVSGSFKIHKLIVRRVNQPTYPQFPRRTVADAATTFSVSDYKLIYTSLTATRAVTLPPTTGLTVGQTFVIKDGAGTAGTNNITIVGTVGGVSNPVAINTNGGQYSFYWDGSAFKVE